MCRMARHDFDVLSILMNRTPKFEVVSKPDLLYGINEIKLRHKPWNMTTTDASLQKTIH